jgi:hypothetical protein
VLLVSTACPVCKPTISCYHAATTRYTQTVNSSRTIAQATRRLSSCISQQHHAAVILSWSDHAYIQLVPRPHSVSRLILQAVAENSCTAPTASTPRINTPSITPAPQPQ